MIIPSDNCAHFIEISLSVYGEDLLNRPWQTFGCNTGHPNLGHSLQNAQTHLCRQTGMFPDFALQKSPELVAEQKAEAAVVAVVAQEAVGYTHKTVLALA
jgi:hypothetical protein